MKHAILILCHKDLELLCKIINYFEYDCDIFIHIDRKSQFNQVQIDYIQQIKNVKLVSQKYAVHWGGFSMLKTELYLMRMALQMSDANYFHLISGQDYPVKPLNEMLTFFEKNKGKNYLSFRKMTYIEIASRFLFFKPYDWISNRHEGKKKIRKLCSIQKKMGIQRHSYNLLYPMYLGSQWFSITRESAAFVLDYTENTPSLYKRMKYTFAPEECYINTVLVHFKFDTCVNNNLRYVRWLSENGNNPSNLTVKHLGGIIQAGDIFARKMEHPYCDKLISIIDELLLKDIENIPLETGAWTNYSLNKYSIDETLAFAIAQIYQSEKLQSALDVGCGCGLYVDVLRRYNVAISGFDGNPNTKELSTLIVGEEYPCEVADLTENLECEDGVPFDLVLCLDVLSHIPKTYEMKAIENLTKICNRYLIVSWGNENNLENPRSKEYIKNNFSKFGFFYNSVGTNYLRKESEKENLKDNLLLFERVRFI